jgi:hypothetical protein
MRINFLDLLELFRILELWDLWKHARDAREGTRLHRWRYVAQGIILIIVAPFLLALPLLIVYLIGK